MSGHSRWSTIKRKKTVADQKRGREFSKIIRGLTIAAREGGGDINANTRLRTLVDKAKEINMPQENITRSIKRGTGELEGVIYEECLYEGYGPSGVAIMVETVTDNKNRTAAEVRHAFSKFGGSLGEAGCVNWMFDKKGVILVSAAETNEDTLMEIGIEHGAEEVQADGDCFRITSAPADFEPIKKAIQDAGIKIESSEISLEPRTYIQLTGKEAENVLRIVNNLEDLDDVQNVYSNFDIPDDVMEKLAS